MIPAIGTIIAIYCFYRIVETILRRVEAKTVASDKTWAGFTYWGSTALTVILGFIAFIIILITWLDLMLAATEATPGF